MRRARVQVLVLVGLVGLVALSVPAGPAAADEGPWGWPLDAPHEVVRDFDPPVSRYGVGHRGVDVRAAPGAAVRASAAGQITYAGRLAGRGVVVVTHGALRTTYEPVSAAVTLGAAVEQGEVVGALEPGHSGCPVAACLHWGLRRGEHYLDPLRLVERGPVRLLPLDVEAPAPALVAGAPVAVSSAAEQRGPASAPRPGSRPVSQPQPGSPPPVSQPQPGSPRRVTQPQPGSPPPATEPQPATDLQPATRQDPVMRSEPAWSLRAREAPLGMAAVVALVLGIGLLARPRPAPDHPGGGSGGMAGVMAPAPEEPAGPPAALLDLDAARLRRRAS